MTCRLVLEDGSVFQGTGFGQVTGADGNGRSVCGEVVFNTAMSGYQEALTDPSYRGQILTMTSPHIGNYGVNREDVESGSVQVAGFVVRELSPIASNYRSHATLADWLAEQGVLGLTGIDTRALTRRLRTAGVLRGVLSSADSETMPDAELVRLARATPPMAGRNLAAEVTVGEACGWSEGLGHWSGSSSAAGTPQVKVVVLDCGAKQQILRHLTVRGCQLVVMPADSSAQAIRAEEPDGLFVSNGPGDPAAVTGTVETLREVAGEVPTFGICLGHQLLCLALGAETFKLKFGHRGCNQPVRNLLTGRVEITSQNHGFAVDPSTLESIDCEATHIHLNDGTLAGFRHRSKAIFAVQYHPEASPGPHDSAYLFDQFVGMMTSSGARPAAVR
ncbi:MAG: carbamoyl-phosphate synthase small subunit [Planctomycetes bacterium]|nr:carbamoyl-phosphate synthase small subunit [Planctomycetota bacterium]NOG52895.1 glutamine-hydrolyzing carbamoyl-phosphate synthase small subunit [Planctomycetota bacterium]